MVQEVSRRGFLLGAAGLGLIVAAPARAAGPEIYTGWLSRTALNGYDAVSYGDGAPVKGRDEFSHIWKGATWLFASAENRTRFRADPEAFAPRYGGHCAYAAARGYRAKGDPLVYKLVDGKLYLNLDRSVQAEWERDIPGEIRRADAAWPKLLR